MREKVLKIGVDRINLAEAKSQAASFLAQPGQFKIFTPNPEMLVKAQKDHFFGEILNTGNLNICDGFGLSMIWGLPRIPGVDFMVEICRIAEEKGKSVYLLGGNLGIAQKAAAVLKEKFPTLKIVGFDEGPKISEGKDGKLEMPTYGVEVENYNAAARINGAEPDILFVAFGMGKQEKWIAENLPKMPSVKIAMGVGGSFDFISGSIKRAPHWMRKIGLEWLYRLIQEPKRVGRILNATIVFTYLAIKEKLI